MSITKFFDLETNGLLADVTKQHCAVTADAEGKYNSFGPGDAALFLKDLTSADIVIGHNIIRYDLPVLEKLFGWKPRKDVQIIDTMVMSRVAFADISNHDMALVKDGRLPGHLMGSHSLEAWGYRLGKMKGEYKTEFKKRLAADGTPYTPGMEWANFSNEMLEYNVQDVVVTVALYEFLTTRTAKYKGLTPMTMELEHRTALIMAEQERNGFPFDLQKAKELYGKLGGERARLQAECASMFAPWVVGKGVVKSKVNSKQYGYVKDTEFSKIEIVHFNPASRAHIADRLTTLYGWVPEKFTPSGPPVIDDAILSKLMYPPCTMLARLMLLDKRIGQLAEGNQAWFRHFNETTKAIHGSVNTNGAVTGRATHSYPNVAQVPAAKSPYGKECRELFIPEPGWILCGTDAAGLELRCLAHYMGRYDGGEYGKKLLTADIHTVNQMAAGLPTRDAAKTFIYAFLYGAGDEKIGSIIGKGRGAGGAIKKRFLTMLPALASLVNAVQEYVERNGFIVGLDGRRLNVRSAHSALNTLLQSAGALICKKWLCEIYAILEERGYKSGEDFRFHAWVHDECQIGVRTQEIADQMTEISREAIKRAEVFFNFTCPLDIDCKTGASWYETH